MTWPVDLGGLLEETVELNLKGSTRMKGDKSIAGLINWLTFENESEKLESPHQPPSETNFALFQGMCLWQKLKTVETELEGATGLGLNSAVSQVHPDDDSAEPACKETL